jgi:hypothetical protein
MWIKQTNELLNTQYTGNGMRLYEYVTARRTKREACGTETQQGEQKI